MLNTHSASIIKTVHLLVRFCTRAFVPTYILENIDGFSEKWNLIMWICFTKLFYYFKLFLCLIYKSLSTIVIWKWNFQTPAKGLESKTPHWCVKTGYWCFLKSWVIYLLPFLFQCWSREFQCHSHPQSFIAGLLSGSC